MNDLTNAPAENDDDITDAASLRPEDELRMLKDRARMMGITIGGNIGVEGLKRKIEAKLAGASEEPEEAPVVPVQTRGVAVAPRVKTKAEREQELRTKIQSEQLVLVRCRIYNLNPSKRDLLGEIITVGNKYLGTVRKFIPFGEATDGGYHIPRCIYNDLKARQFQHISSKKNAKGIDEITTRLVPEYSIEILSNLTRDELNELALKQAAAERLGAN